MTGAGADCEALEEAGAWLGCCRLLELELDDVPLDELDEVAPVELDELAVVWPWNDRAAASETVPVATTAPAISHRLIRPISANPASRALTAFLLMLVILAARRKKTLSRL